MRKTTRVRVHDALREMAGKGVWLCSARAIARLAQVDIVDFRVAAWRDRELAAARVGRTHFINPYAELPMNALAQLAPAFRKNSHYYLSLESVLHEHDWISQIPNRLTFITDGKASVYETPIGTLEFNRVSAKGFQSLRMAETVFDPNKLVFVATPEQALRDLQSLGRSLDLVRRPEPVSDTELVEVSR